MGNSFKELCNRAGQRRGAEGAVRREIRKFFQIGEIMACFLWWWKQSSEGQNSMMWEKEEGVIEAMFLNGWQGLGSGAHVEVASTRSRRFNSSYIVWAEDCFRSYVSKERPGLLTCSSCDFYILLAFRYERVGFSNKDSAEESKLVQKQGGIFRKRKHILSVLPMLFGSGCFRNCKAAWGEANICSYDSVLEASLLLPLTTGRGVPIAALVRLSPSASVRTLTASLPLLRLSPPPPGQLPNLTNCTSEMFSPNLHSSPSP